MPAGTLIETAIASVALVLPLAMVPVEGVTVTPAQGLSGYCRCSQERVAAMMRSFDPSDIAEMREPDGAITVTCEFCNTKYRLEPGEQV